MARKRDYALEWERRKIRAQGAGFSSPREKTAQRKSGKSLEEWQRDKALAKRGISQVEFQRIRRQNKSWAKEHNNKRLAAINKYNVKADAAIHDWSDDRVGYIVSFNAMTVGGEALRETKPSTGSWYRDLLYYSDLIEDDYGNTDTDYDDPYSIAMG